MTNHSNKSKLHTVIPSQSTKNCIRRRRNYPCCYKYIFQFLSNLFFHAAKPWSMDLQSQRNNDQRFSPHMKSHKTLNLFLKRLRSSYPEGLRTAQPSCFVHRLSFRMIFYGSTCIRVSVVIFYLFLRWWIAWCIVAFVSRARGSVAERRFLGTTIDCTMFVRMSIDLFTEWWGVCFV